MTLSLKNLQAYLTAPPPVKKTEEKVQEKEVVKIEEVEEDKYFLYPYKTKFEAAKEIKGWFDSVSLPEIILIKCAKLKKEYIKATFDLIKKYWNDTAYVRDRLSDLITIKNFLPHND